MSSRIAKIKKIVTILNTDEDIGKLSHSYIAGVKVKLDSSLAVLQKKPKLSNTAATTFLSQRNEN